VVLGRREPLTVTEDRPPPRGVSPRYAAGFHADLMNHALSRFVLLTSLTFTSCAARSSVNSTGVDGLTLADEPCPGPFERSVVRVTTGSIHYGAPLAFMREPMVYWVVPLTVVEVESGPFEGDELGAVVHSPSMFASAVWGFGESTLDQAAGLELAWQPEYCMYEITEVLPPKPLPREPFILNLPDANGMVTEGD
jgi:hypothetical protein